MQMKNFALYAKALSKMTSTCPINIQYNIAYGILGSLIVIMSLIGVLRRNIVLVVCIPSLVALHYAWYSLQYNEEFVNQEERRITKVAGLITLSDRKKDEK
jgi:hypothetical protein